MKPTMDLADRYSGCLLGLAVGDALGAPLSFMKSEQIHIKHGTVREMLGGGWLLLRPGQYTTGTALAMRVADSLIEKKTLDEADVAARFADWYRTGPRDLAGALRTALAILAEGADVSRAAEEALDLTGEESADNGTLTRAAPLALRFHGRRGELQDAAAREARITHRDPRAAAGSAAFAVLLSFLLDGVDRADAFDSAWDWLEDHSREIGNLLPDVPSKKESALDPSTFVIDTLETALWYFLTAPSFEEVLVRTANRGGDAATTTAVAGALAGAHFGVGAIPRRWLRTLADRTVIRHQAADLLSLQA